MSKKTKYDKYQKQNKILELPSGENVLQAVLIKIVTEILFGNAPLVNHETTVLAASHRPAH